jgi:hypothetical protein
MNFKEFCAHQMVKYPFLYTTKTDVYHHIFLVIGNGYEWHEGRLSTMDSNAEWFNIDEYESNGADITETIKLANGPFNPWAESYGMYPMSRYALLLHVPANVSDEMYTEAREFAKFLFSIGYDFEKFGSLIREKFDIK